MKKIFVSLLACLIFTTSVMGSTGELTIDFTKDLKGERTYYYGPGAEFRLYLSESVVRAEEQYYAAYHIYPNEVKKMNIISDCRCPAPMCLAHLR